TSKMIDEIVAEVAGEDVLPIAKALKNKKNISEFAIAQELKEEVNIVRNKLKINAVINNAKSYLILKQDMSFSNFLWQFVGGVPIQNNWQTMAEIPAHTEISDQMAKALKQKQFKFIGTTICYAFMQATGMVNDHVVSCYRHTLVQK
ncbi:MAG: DNA-3-methyladenine glycosylase I, partial [Legionella sp.]|nr:DNA-3-methyladenine glycosylase I [Legionella sp.]